MWTRVSCKDEAAQIAKAYKTANKTIRNPTLATALGALPKFAEVVDGRHRTVSRPPVIIPLRDLAASYEMTPAQARNTVEEQFRAYKATISNNRRQLLDRFTIVDAARKVVGVGSVGTRAFMVLLQGRDSADPLSSRSRRPLARSSRTTCPSAATPLPRPESFRPQI